MTPPLVRSAISPALVAGCAALFATTTHAEAPLRASNDPQTVVGGAPVHACGFPSAAEVLVGGYRCSAVLVHPRVVVLDATCPDYTPIEIDFDVIFSDGPNVDEAHYEVVQRFDCTFDDRIGVCVLAQPSAVPFTPIAAGCETTAIHDGAPATLVGLGATNETGVLDDSKLFGEVTIQDVGAEAFFVHGDASPCDGDSGAPVFVQVADGSWRVAGVSLDTPCDNPSPFRYLPAMIPWIESTTGIDITPCHDADGFPDPSPQCEGFYAGGTSDDGTWADLCAGVPLGPAGGVCSGDAVAPAVAIVTPEASPASFAPGSTVRVEVTADDADGVGLRDVRLQIDGAIQPMELTEAPFAFDVDFPLGSWTVAAVARDWGGNVAYSTELEIQIEPRPDDDGSADGSSTDADDGAGSTTGGAAETTGNGDGGSTTGVEPPPQDGSSSSGCSTGARRTGDAWLLVVGAMLLRRRRRSAMTVRTHTSTPGIDAVP